MIRLFVKDKSSGANIYAGPAGALRPIHCG